LCGLFSPELLQELNVVGKDDHLFVRGADPQNFVDRVRSSEGVMAAKWIIEDDNSVC